MADGMVFYGAVDHPGGQQVSHSEICLPPLPPLNSCSLMHCPKYVGVLALLAAMATYSADAGVCYSPWHHSSVTDSVLQADFSQIKEYFTSIRTFHAQFSGQNVINEAAKAGIKVAVGIQMSDAAAIESEITAACTGAVANPSSVEAIFVGNENMVNGDFGTFTAAQLVEYIQRIKTCTSGTGIKVGSVQRMNEWSDASDAATLAAACDIIGVNIYPFFTEGPTKPIEKLEAQWSQITTQYSGKDVQLTETGWPRQGASYAGNAPSQETTQTFFDDFITWSSSHPNSYYFMMYDTTVSYSGADYEKFFGLADTTGKLQITIPTVSTTTTTTSSGSAQEETETPAPASTEAPATATPTETPAATVTPAETEAPAATVTPAETEAPAATPSATTSTEAPTAAPTAAAPTTEAPAATPSATTGATDNLELCESY